MTLVPPVLLRYNGSATTAPVFEGLMGDATERPLVLAER
jgi:hypothetical protein